MPAMAGTAVCEHFLRKIPNDYAYKNGWLSDNSKSVSILVMGSSHSYFGIDPVYFSGNAFNAAHVSQSIKYDHFIFSKFIDEMDSLEVLILPISYFSIGSYGLEKEEDWRVKYYSIYYGCKYHRFEPKYNFEVSDGLQYKGVIKSIMGRINHRVCTDLGWGASYKLENRADNWKDSGDIAAKRHTQVKIDSSIVAKNNALVKEMIMKCAQKNACVILLTTPTYQTYREALNQEQLNLMVECSEGFASGFDNVYYLNLLDDNRFQEDDFYDADHLNEYGALKLTTILQQTIDSLGLLKIRN